MRTTITLDDALYAQALEMMAPGADAADLVNEALKTFVRIQAGKRLAALGGTALEETAGEAHSEEVLTPPAAP
jgi:Arc/MetJ family transcription regulator